MKYVFSVAKTYLHRGKRRHLESTKKHWYIYYYDEARKFHSERVSFAKALYYKKRMYHRLRCYCDICRETWILLVRSKKEKLQCPICKV